MAAIICQFCNRSNPDTLEICQFCGTPLKNRGTEPLPTIRPGEMPVKQQTSELESTLPGWLRDMRKGDDGQPAAPQTVKPTTLPKKEPAPLDFLAGLSQLNDDEDEEPDWLSSLKGTPSTPAPTAGTQAPVDWMAGLTAGSTPAPKAPVEPQPDQPVDWLAGLQENTPPRERQPETPAATAWGGFSDLEEEPAAPAESTPDWLSALKAQDNSINAPTPAKDDEFDDTELSLGDYPDWLSNLSSSSTPTPAAAEPDAFSTASFSSASFNDDTSLDDNTSFGGGTSFGGDDLSSWLTDAAPATPVVTPSLDSPAQTDDFPDWLSSLGSEQTPSQSAPTMPTRPADAPSAAAIDDFPDWMSSLGGEKAAEPVVPQTASAAPSAAATDDFPDWMSSLGGEKAAEPIVPQTASAVPSAAVTDDFSDWISGLGGEKAAEPVVPQASSATPSAAATDDFPDWISGLGDEKAATPEVSQSTSSTLTTSATDDFPDWMSSLGGEKAAEPEVPQASLATPSAATTDDFSDWISGLGGEKAAEPVVSQSASATPTTSATDEFPDWMSSLGGEKAAEPELPQASSAAPSAAATDDFPDWMSSLGGEKAAEPEVPQAASATPSAAATDDFPDWMSSLGGEKAVESELPQASSAAPSAATTDDFPDWMSSLGGEKATEPEVLQASSATPSPAATDDFPDWMSSLGGEKDAEPEVPQAVSIAPIASVTTEFPDWFSNLSDETTAELEDGSQSLPIASVGMQDSSTTDFPDWLSDLGGEKSESVPVVMQDTSTTTDVPDWVADLGGVKAAEPEKAQDASGDWLSSNATDKASVSSAAETPADDAASLYANLMTNDNVGWLDTAPSQEKPTQLPAKKPFSTGSLEGLDSLQPSGDVPDWLANLNAATQKKAAESEPDDLPGMDTSFDWLTNAAANDTSLIGSTDKGQSDFAAEKPKVTELPSSAFPAGASQSADSLFSLDVPDWLTGFTPSQPVDDAASEPSEPMDDNFGQAELPSWVQAMRPIESSAAVTQGGVDDQIVEQIGPLAGMRSVLPAQVNVPGLRKPKPYFIKLQVDSTQRAQATLLEKLIASEAESRPVVTAKRVVNYRSLRLVIALILLLVTLAMGILGSFGIHIFPLPAPANAQVNPETFDFYNAVEGLPDAAKVLVVFDYQPGYAGEMEQAAGPVMSHLMKKNARMAFVSTLPTGVLMGERMMAVRNQLDVAYNKGTEYIDLGYLPGDSAGIQVFAQNPAGILGRDYRDGNLWTVESGFDRLLNTIDAQPTISGFDAVIVLSDNPDTGRTWIEQAGSALGATKPMLMVVSAQAAPMILPYYQSHQIKGLVSGLAGGVLYEVASQQPAGKGSISYWDAYGAGILAAELLIVIGGVWAVTQRLRVRRVSQNQEEDEE